MHWLIWIVSGGLLLIIFLLLSLVLNHYQSMGWQRVPSIWRTRRGIRRLVRSIFPDASVSSMGMSSIDPQYFCILINVKTDSEKQQLLQYKELEGRMRKIALDAGYPAEANQLIGFSIESQQTVDRDFAGNWFYARK